jgi:hypothetical protein
MAAFVDEMELFRTEEQVAFAASVLIPNQPRRAGPHAVEQG